MKPIRVGWIIGDQLARSNPFGKVDVSHGGSSLVRFSWMGSHINSDPEFNIRNDIYKPWKRFDCLIFLKSMGEKSIKLLARYLDKGMPVIFDANVNYYEISGTEYYDNMLPSEEQKHDAIEMTRRASAVIADSRFIASKCSELSKNVRWIPDNVRMDIVPAYRGYRKTGKRLRLLWSGVALKLFELLLIEEVLLKYSKYIELVIVTNSLEALDRWKPGYKERFWEMMNRLEHTITPYQSIENLFDIYSGGGVFVSPRFLDNSYNLGHTEWKITLAMACGRMALCSPVASYVEVNERADGIGIRICDSLENWDKALDELVSSEIEMEREETGAIGVVKEHYSTSVVGSQHAGFIKEVVDR